MLTPEQDSEQIVAALEYLRHRGMTRDQLCDLHHSPLRTEGFGAAISYRRSNPYREYKEPNLTYHRRLLFVAVEHQRTARPFGNIVAEAIQRFTSACPMKVSRSD